MIANAVVHRSYLDKSCIQVCIFDDRIEVLSPGMLYGGLDLETAKLGKSTCRNEVIAESFHYMRIVEAWGTGIPRIINRCKEYGLPEPLFEEFGDGFKVTMFRKIKDVLQEEKISTPKSTPSTPKSTPSTPKSTPSTSDFASEPTGLYESMEKKKDASLREQILDLIERDSSISKKRMIEKLGVSMYALKKELSAMKKEHIAEYIGYSRSGRWKIYKHID